MGSNPTHKPSRQSPNRLAEEKSPYLQQHAWNPVDWHPWDATALELARAKDMPIFLSVGYSTCYWCHVMERESFENDAIAAEMNRHFVNIKVDREQRPDLDHLYMTATQILTQQGGWPMSVWLTPDLKPFYAGTYFPPTDAHGRPGFPRLIDAIADAWKERRADIEHQADQVTHALQQLAKPPAPAPLPDRDMLLKWIERSCEDYEPKFGGFGHAPKFPRETLLQLILDAQPNANAPIAQMLRHTLSAMADGGIRDHLGGGFHRYSTDARWLVPHFEIMLYDQALLAPVYAEAAHLFDEPRFERVARGVCDFVLREMTSPLGAFYTALDAEVDAREGKSYLWTLAEVRSILGDDAERFARVYGLDRAPNFADPHHDEGVARHNILFLPDGASEEDSPEIVRARETLLRHRSGREQPLLDTKILTAWNGLMIEALAKCSALLHEPRYLQAAMRAADYLLSHHVDASNHIMQSSRDGVTRTEASLDDEAFLVAGLTRLYQVTDDRRWRDVADRLATAALDRYLHRQSDQPSGVLYFTPADRSDVLVRQPIVTDSPLPAGAARMVSALCLLDRHDEAESIARSLSPHLERMAESMSATISAILQCRMRGQVTTVATSRNEIASNNEPELTVRATRVNRRRVEVSVQIGPGLHVYDTHTDSSLGLTPTRLRVSPRWAGLLDAIEYPPASALELPYGPPVRGYEGSIDLVVVFREDLPAHKVEMSIAFQACDSTSCRRPGIVRFEA